MACSSASDFPKYTPTIEDLKIGMEQKLAGTPNFVANQVRDAAEENFQEIASVYIASACLRNEVVSSVGFRNFLTDVTEDAQSVAANMLLSIRALTDDGSELKECYKPYILPQTGEEVDSF